MSSTKFTEETRQIIIDALRENPSISSAAVAADIGATTLHTWLRKGEEGDPEFSEFAQDCAHARAFMKNDIVAALFKTACDELHPQQCKAAQLLLSSLYPTEFSKVSHKVVHTAPSKVDEVDFSKLTQAECRAFQGLLKKVEQEDDMPRALPANVIDVVNAKPAKDAN